MRHLGFLKDRISNCRYGTYASMRQYASPCKISHWLVKPLRIYSDFSTFMTAAAAILGFKNSEFLRVGRVKRDKNMSQRQISRWSFEPLLQFRYLSIFQDSGRVFGRAFGGLYHCAKFGWNQRSSFDNMHVFQFRQFGWRTPIHAPKIVFLGDLTP